MTDGASNGTLVATLLNQANSPDALLTVTLTGMTRDAIKTTIAGGTVVLPPKKGVQLAFTGAVRFEGNLVQGADYTITMTFKNGEPIDDEDPGRLQGADVREGAASAPFRRPRATRPDRSAASRTPLSQAMPTGASYL